MFERKHEMMAFLIGAAAGGAAALLLAPTSGSELRHRIGEGAEKARDDAQQKVKAVGNQVTARYEETAEQAHRLVTSAKDSAGNYRHAVAVALEEGMKAYEREIAKAS